MLTLTTTNHAGYTDTYEFADNAAGLSAARKSYELALELGYYVESFTNTSGNSMADQSQAAVSWNAEATEATTEVTTYEAVEVTLVNGETFILNRNAYAESNEFRADADLTDAEALTLVQRLPAASRPAASALLADLAETFEMSLTAVKAAGAQLYRSRSGELFAVPTFALDGAHVYVRGIEWSGVGSQGSEFSVVDGQPYLI